MIKKLLKSLFISFSLIYILSACDNILSVNESSENIRSDGQTYVRFSVTGSSSRTVHLPDLSSLTYTLEYSKGSDSRTKNFASKDELTSTALPLESGSWNFTIYAKNGENIVYSASQSNVSISKGTENTISFTLAEPADGKGSINATITAPSVTGLTRITATLKNMDGSIAQEESSLTISGTTASYTKSDLAKGPYLLVYTFYVQGDGDVTATTNFMEFLRVVSGLTTSVTSTISSSDLNSLCSITYMADSSTIFNSWKSGYTPVLTFVKGEQVTLPTSESISRPGYIFTGWYKDSSYSGSALTEITLRENTNLYAKWTDAKVYVYSSGSDSNDGLSASSPVKTLGGAISKINALVDSGSASSDIDWEIILSGQILGQTEISALSASSITINPLTNSSGSSSPSDMLFGVSSSGTETAALPVISVTSSISADITINKMFIAYGKGGISMAGSGKLTIADSMIAYNTSSALYLGAGSTDISNTMIVGNSGGENGGGIYIGDGASCTFTGGQIANNGASSLGNGVYNNGTFAIGGSCLISSLDPIYLPSGKYLTIASDLTSSTSPVATITPASCVEGEKVLADFDGQSFVASNYSKIGVSSNGTSSVWAVNSAGNLYEKCQVTFDFTTPSYSNDDLELQASVTSSGVQLSAKSGYSTYSWAIGESINETTTTNSYTISSSSITSNYCYTVLLLATDSDGNTHSASASFTMTVSSATVTMDTGASINALLIGDTIDADTISGYSFEPYTSSLTASQLAEKTTVTLSTSSSAVPCYAWADSSENKVYYYAAGYTDSGKLIPLNSYSSSMFAGTQFTSIDLSGFESTLVRDMSSMFSGCSSLTSVDLSTIRTPLLTNLDSTFSGCSALTSLDLSRFDTSAVTSMNKTFYGCKALSSLDVSNFDTSSVTNMSNIFYSCQGLTSIDLSGFNTEKVTNMSYMFCGCRGLTSLDLSSLNTEKVTNMSYMFYGCSALTSLDLVTFDTAAVTNMSSMFASCSALTSLDLRSFKTAAVTNMEYMFSSCSRLSSIDLSGFDTSSLTLMKYMFSSCSALTSLDLSSFNTEKVTQMTSLFQRCSSLESVNLSSFNTAAVTTMNSMFSNCSSLTSLDLSSFNTAAVTDMTEMFYNCSKITSLDLSNFNTAKVAAMLDMFNNCVLLTSLDVSSFNTAAVLDMCNMFKSCSALTSLDLQSFDTSSVTDMSSMFSGDSALTTIKVKDGLFVTSAVTTSSDMFTNCTALVGGAGTAYDSSNTNAVYAKIDGGTSSPGYFTDPNALGAVNMLTGSQIQTLLAGTEIGANSTTGLSFLPYRSSLSSLPSSYVTLSESASPVPCYAWKDGSNVYYYAEGYTDSGNLIPLNADSSSMFASLKFVSIDMTAFSTENVTTMKKMFTLCTALVSLDISSFDTSNVTDMSYMFNLCGELKTLTFDKNKFVTSKVTTMENMFYACSELTSLDVSNFDTSSVTNMDSTFFSCSKLTALDVSNFNTEKVTTMNSMFNSCSGLTSLDVSGFKTSLVEYFFQMFNECSNLTELDISNFDISAAKNIAYMFSVCSKLTSIYAVSGTNWSTASSINSGSMFSNCTSLVGGSGTAYDSSKTDATYAKIDGGTDSPGYFTAR